MADISKIAIDGSIYDIKDEVARNKQEIFWCTYGTTTYEEIQAAIAAGKIPVTTRSNRIYRYQYASSSSGYYFIATSAHVLYQVQCKLDSSWSNKNYDIPDPETVEDISNKVTSISASSTDTQYPSAKCVYDLVGNIITLLDSL